MSPSQLEEVRKAQYQRLNWTNLQYATNVKLFPEKDEDSKDTLFWEFGKSLSQVVVGDGPGSPIGYLIITISLAMDALDYIEIQKALNQLIR